MKQAAGNQLSVNSPNYLFPAIRGIQASREYYVTMVPLRLVPRIFVFNEKELPPELRAQRPLNKARVPELASYIVKNPKDYVFSAVTASVDGHMKFVPVGDEENDVGTLQIPMSSRILINDGQHRRAAIEGALAERPELGVETISVVLFQDAGLERSQQMFADLNRYAIRPSKSLGILYDRRDPFSKLALDIIHEIPVFREYTDLEKTSISNRSLKLFTLNGIYKSTRILLRKEQKKAKVASGDLDTAVEYWGAVSEHMRDWQALVRGSVSAARLRREYISAHGLALNALGIVGAQLLEMHPKEWKDRLQALQKVDWRRSNGDLWGGRALVHGRLSKRQINIQLTANVLKNVLDLPLTPEDEAIEREHGPHAEVLVT